VKPTDADSLHDAGLISDEQHHRITAFLAANTEPCRRFARFLFFIGGIVAVLGIILLISANWERIPRGIKLAGGLLLMVGSHWGGTRLASRSPAGAAALHLAGSGLFLANIALVGQIYHLVSKPGNALLLWCAGLAPLPWLLRSKAQFILLQLGALTWFAVEINTRQSALHVPEFWAQCVVFTGAGALLLGLGSLLRLTPQPRFAPPMEKCALLVMHIAIWPVTWIGSNELGGIFPDHSRFSGTMYAVLGGTGLVLLGWSFIKRNPFLSRVDRILWLLAIGLLLGFLWFRVTRVPDREDYGVWTSRYGPQSHQWLTMAVVFAFCLVQIRIGTKMDSGFMANLALTVIGLHLIRVFVFPIGTMSKTGWVLLGTGVIVFVQALFVQRRSRIRKNTQSTAN
jgi:uncharacterized membrane protein